MAHAQSRQGIPTHLTLKQFEEFVLPHLHTGSRGPQPKLALHVIFNYILKLLYLGCQWKELRALLGAHAKIPMLRVAKAAILQGNLLVHDCYRFL